jgi:hypothetical protein
MVLNQTSFFSINRLQANSLSIMLLSTFEYQMLGRIVMRGMSLLFAALAACVIVLVGCGKETPEDAVISQYMRGEEAIATRDVANFRNTMTHESWDAMTEELKLAREAKEPVVKALSNIRCARVIALRNRCSTNQLKNMSTEDYFVWLVDQGLVGVDADSGVYPHKVTIRGDVAEMQMGAEVDSGSSGLRVRRRGGAVRALGGLVAKAAEKRETEAFKNLEGHWYHDFDGNTPFFNDWYASAAAASGGSVHDAILEIENEEHGSLKENIWKPPF